MAYQVFYAEGLYVALGVLIMATIWLTVVCRAFESGLPALLGLVTLVLLVTNMILSWHDFADHPLTCSTRYPAITDGDGPEYALVLDPRSEASQACSVNQVSVSEIQTLAGDMEMQADCPDARAAWKVYANGRLLEEGTLQPDEELDLTRISISSRAVPQSVRFAAVRIDSAECQATLTLVDPGLEGAGHGPFRFSFPEFATDPE